MIVKGKKTERAQGQTIRFGLSGTHFPIIFRDFYCLLYNASQTIRIEKEDFIENDGVYKAVVSKETTAHMDEGIYTLELIDKSEKGENIKVVDFVRIYKSKGKDYLCEK